MRHHVPLFVSFINVALLVIILLALKMDDDWVTKSTRCDSGTHYSIQGYIVTIPMLQIPKIPERSKYKLQQSRAAVVHTSPQLHRWHKSKVVATRPTHLHMCICINCARVIDCSAYYFVETKHEQPHIAAQPTFTPRDGSPTIHVNIRAGQNNRVWSAEMKHDGIATEKVDSDKVGEGTGETIIPMSTTYTEYDVVACADYVEDMNCWVRNMPDEIKRANPNFVPT